MLALGLTLRSRVAYVRAEGDHRIQRDPSTRRASREGFLLEEVDSYASAFSVFSLDLSLILNRSLIGVQLVPVSVLLVLVLAQDLRSV